MTIAWIPEMDETLAAMVAAGASWRKIAKCIGVSHPVAMRRAQALDLPAKEAAPRVWADGPTPAMAARLQALYEAGASWAAARAATRLSHRRIRRYAAMLGISFTPGPNPARDARLRALHASGLSQQEAAAAMGVCVQTIWRWSGIIGLQWKAGRPSRPCGRLSDARGTAIARGERRGAGPRCGSEARP